LHTPGDFAFASIANKKMNMIRGHNVVENTKPVPRTSLKQPDAQSLPIPGEFKQEIPPVAAVGDVPNMA
jgi:hypothetical protein